MSAPRRLLALLAAAAVAFVALLVGGAPAYAQFNEEIKTYDVQLTVSVDGGLHVREIIGYDFGVFHRHGIIREIPEVTRDDRYDRTWPIDNVKVSSADAPAQTKVSRSEGRVTIRVGDPDRTITGLHTYTIDYDVDGALEHFDEPFDHVELRWDAVGDEWKVPIRRATVRVTGPANIRAETCFAGELGSLVPCARHQHKGKTAAFSESGLAAGQGLTVVVAFPTGTVAATGPILHERPSVRRSFALTPLSLTLTGLALLMVIIGIARVWWVRGRDRRYIGQVPGLVPAKGQVIADEPTPLFGDTPTAVEFAPPDHIRPGQVGTILDERANTLDVTATIVDLAVRKHLRIDELEQEHWWTKKDWQLTKLPEPEGDTTLEYEQRLLKGLFRKGDVVKLSELKDTFYKDLNAVENQLYDDVVRAGYFSRRPDIVRGQWLGVALAIIAAGGIATYFLYRYTHLALVGLPIVLAGIAMLALRNSMPAKTAKGSAMLARILGFRRYLTTAEAEQLKFEEKADVFARYLPFAIVFGVTERWAKAFERLAATDPEAADSLGWYGGPHGWTLGYFAASMSNFTTSANGTLVSAPSTSGSGSGFSGGGGGGSGGGGGGGGGGSW